MAKPKDTLWEMEPHTAAKHSILRRYLQAWIPIMSRLVGRWASDGRGRLVLVDGFCGPGRYVGGEDGSPLIMLNAFLQHSQREGIRAELVYAFIDEDQRRTAHLRDEIASLAAQQPDGRFPDQVKIDVVDGRFEDVFTETLDDLEEEGKRLAPAFAFIDPFGYKDASMKLTDRLLRFERCEALIYMPLPFVNRFIGMPEQEEVMDQLFGTPDWRKAIPLRGEQRRRFLHDLFRDQLASEAGDRLVRSFEIGTAKGTGYHLFFTTGHEKGMEAMKDAMWSVDREEGRRFRDSTDEDQLVIFDQVVDTGPLLDSLRRHFGGSEFTIEEAMSHTIRDTPYKSSHLKTMTLKPAEQDGSLEVLSDRNLRGTYPKGTKLRFVLGRKRKLPGLEQRGHFVPRPALKSAPAGLRRAAAPLLEEERDALLNAPVAQIADPLGPHRAMAGA
jgi:three-Cys-motif partner protein